MNSRLSVVIPTLNAAATLPFCLASLMAGAELIGEIILADGGSTDGTAQMPGMTVISAPTGRGGQLAAGIAAASNEFVLLLHGDSWLGQNWQAALRQAIENPEYAHYFRLKLDSRHFMARVIEAGAALRCRIFGLPYGDQGLVIAKTLLAEIGGMPALPLMEDVALARALRGRLRGMRATAITSAQRYEQDGWLKRPAKNLYCLTRYFCGTPIEKIRRLYG